MEYKYARRMSEIKASEIRELLKLTKNRRLFPLPAVCPPLSFSPSKK